MEDFKFEVDFSSTITPTAIADHFPDISSVDFFYILLNLIRLKDPHTFTHSIRVSELSDSLAKKLGFNGRNLVEITTAAYLHDIGKLIIHDNILKKNGSLTPLEFQDIQKHTLAGAEMLAGIKSLKRVREIIRQHHERFDGSGYPDGLSGPEIDVGARIITIADNYDALTGERIYRECLSSNEVLTHMGKGLNRQFDPELFSSFHEMINNGFRFSPLANLSRKLVDM